eukprot:CAMPEP_0205923256 /NCGR_PEP_ID=MMETSP1325-20131115/15915_1 /ASSEMBLY_ACC=CAM_ASM_000708 /TAXON_ID=236786 /ORGANISM="Florenciella sp., Strain RCC1007" /LENGTH=128 /DNA_ID=CAMNT_0053291443 /DNA_START=84 /DNA_END=470 /DNA_ORIENTATION=+
MRPVVGGLRVAGGGYRSVVTTLESGAEWESFQAAAMKDTNSVAYFTAAWCGPCKRIAPIYEELSDSHPTITFAKVDIDQNQTAASKAAIKSVPTFMFFKDGNFVGQFSGADHQLLEETLAKMGPADDP